MRHLWSLLLALALTPLIYAAAGLSAVRLSDARGFGIAAAVGLVAGLVAGGLYAVLVMMPLSPVGPIVAGATYLGVTVWSLLDKSGFEGFLPSALFGEDGVLQRPVGMGTALLAGPLLLTVFSARRWRGTEEPPVPAVQPPAPPAAVAPAAPAQEPTPSYPDTAVIRPTYTPATGPPSGAAGAPTYEPPVYTPPGRS